MKIGVNLKIDVTNIDKNLLVRGQKGTYLDATVFINPDEADQYGNHGMITQEVGKEKRDAGDRGAILGNAKVFWSDSQQAKSQSGTDKPQKGQPGFDDLSDDIPF